jgi:hypothetical protein
MDYAHWLSCGAARNWLSARGAGAGLMAGPGFPASGGVRTRRASDTGMACAGEETPARAAGLMPLYAAGRSGVVARRAPARTARA